MYNYSLFKFCQSSEGNQLLHKAGVETDTLNPSHQYVPWTVANGKHDSTVEEAIMSDLVYWACKNYRGTTKIDACAFAMVE